jgi:CTP synthase
MRLGAYAAKLSPASLVCSLYRETGRISKDRLRIRRLLRDETQRFRLGKIKDRRDVVLERHRHRYEVSPKYTGILERKGLVFSGYHLTSAGTKLMEFLEIPSHPFFVATQSHPEFKSSLENPAPLFYGFIGAALKRRRSTSS